MTLKQITMLREVLARKQAELTRQLTSSHERLAVEQLADPTDQVQYVAARDAALRGVDREMDLLRRVTAALEEIGDGTFGQCASCGEEIPLKRLRAVPWARLCVACQRRAEAGELPRMAAQARLHAA